jgi:NAD(P)-dependent dehydrogenase (short-subunit alcohol dehydrogenase family)
VLVNNARCRCHPFCARFLRLPVCVRHSVRHERDICRDHDAALSTTTAQISVWHYHQRLVRKGFVGDFVFREDAAPPVSIPYSVSKTALNALTLEMAKLPENEGVQFHVIGPGHCKTEFNGFRRTRDPLEGANVVVELVDAEKGTYPNAGFWQTEGASKELVRIPW